MEIAKCLVGITTFTWSISGRNFFKNAERSIWEEVRVLISPRPDDNLIECAFGHVVDLLLVSPIPDIAAGAKIVDYYFLLGSAECYDQENLQVLRKAEHLTQALADRGDATAAICRRDQRIFLDNSFMQGYLSVN